jgi:hypothetical protein
MYYAKDKVYSSKVMSLQQLKGRILVGMATITQDISEGTCQEFMIIGWLYA